MRRLLHRTAATFMLASIGTVTAGGCADNDSSLYIAGVMFEEAPDCDVDPSISAEVLLSGVLDVAFSVEYRGVLLVGNQMAPRGDKDNVRAETSHVVLKGAEVRLENSVGGTISEFTVPGSGVAHVNTSREPGFGAVGTTLIPPNIGAQYAARGDSALDPGSSITLVANVRVFGDTLGGRELESAELSYPIRVCHGCTVIFDQLSADSAGNRLVCDADGEPSIDPPCNLGQGAVSCVSCFTRSSLCQCVGTGC